VDAELKIKIGAETQQAEAGIKKVTQALGNLKPGANQATFALSNLSKVAQDAPFGLIGIANNIEPLINSFRSLGAETKTAKGFFTALGSSLIGGGGLVLAVGLASAAMSLFGKSMQGAGKDSKSAADEIKRAIDVVGEATDSVQGDISKVKALSNVLLDTNKSYRERQAALESLQKTNKAYFGDLSLEKSSYEQITSAVNSYSQALVQQAIVQGLQKEIASLATELRAATKEYYTLAQQAATANKVLRDEQNKAQGKAVEGLAATNTQLVFAQTQYDRYAKKLNVAAGSLQKLQDLNKELTDEISKQVGETLKLKPLEDNTKTVKDKVSKFDPKQFFKESIVGFNEELYKLEKEAEKQFGEVGKKVGTKLSDTIGGNFNPESLATKLKEKLQIALNRAAELGIRLPDLTKFSGDLSRLQFVDEAIAKFEILQGKAKQLGETITNALSPAFDAFFKTLLDGSGSPFKAFGEALKQMIVQLTATIAKALLLQLVLNAINPGQAVGSGFGSFFKQALSNFGGGLTGGIANGGINVGGITGAANVGGQKLVAEVSGTSLKFLLDKTNGSIKRGF